MRCQLPSQCLLSELMITIKISKTSQHMLMPSIKMSLTKTPWLEQQPPLSIWGTNWTASARCLTRMTQCICGCSKVTFRMFPPSQPCLITSLSLSSPSTYLTMLQDVWKKISSHKRPVYTPVIKSLASKNKTWGSSSPTKSRTLRTKWVPIRKL